MNPTSEPKCCSSKYQIGWAVEGGGAGGGGRERDVEVGAGGEQEQLPGRHGFHLRRDVHRPRLQVEPVYVLLLSQCTTGPHPSLSLSEVDSL